MRESNETAKKLMGLVRQWWGWLEKQIFEDTSTGGVKFSALDGLRGVAVLMVFLSHSSGFNQRLLPWLNFRYFGHLGVYLFFVLSGFMLAYGLLGRRGTSLGGFYGRRFLRIAPLYYFVVTGVFAIQLISGQPDFCHLLVSGGWWGYFRHLVFMQGDSVFWTIAVEFQFYLILPGLIWLLQRYGARAFWGLAVFGLAYGLWGLMIKMGQVDAGWALRVPRITHETQYVDVFLAGVLAAVVARGEWWERMVRERAGLLRAVVWGVVGALVIASCVFVAARFLVFEQVWPMLRHFSFLYAAGFAVVVLGVSHLGGRLSDWMNHKFLRLIGVTCFSWYLLHFVAINLVHGWFGFRWTPQLMGLPWTWLEPTKFVLSFVLTLVVSVVTYLLVEKPFILMSRRFVVRKAG